MTFAMGGVCHFLLQCMKVKSESEVAQSWPLELLRGSQAPCRAVCGTRGSLRTMHGGGSAPSCCAFTHRVAFEEGGGGGEDNKVSLIPLFNLIPSTSQAAAWG